MTSGQKSRGPLRGTKNTRIRPQSKEVRATRLRLLPDRRRLLALTGGLVHLREVIQVATLHPQPTDLRVGIAARPVDSQTRLHHSLRLTHRVRQDRPFHRLRLQRGEQHQGELPHTLRRPGGIRRSKILRLRPRHHQEAGIRRLKPVRKLRHPRHKLQSFHHRRQRKSHCSSNSSRILRLFLPNQNPNRQTTQQRLLQDHTQLRLRR